MKWCETFHLEHNQTEERLRVMVCPDEEIKYLILDAVEETYKKRGYKLVRVEIIGRVDDVLTAEKTEQ